MQSLLQPFVAAALGIAGLVLGIVLLPLVLATIFAIALVVAGAIAFARWRLRHQLAGMARNSGTTRQGGQRPGGRVIEAEYEVIRER